MTQAFRSVLIVLLLWCAGLCAAMQFAKISVPFAQFQALYPDLGPGLGWLLSVISLVGALTGAVAGGLAGRLGSVRVLVGGMVLGGVISLIQSVLPEFKAMLALRVLEGASHVAIVVAAPTLIVQASAPAYRGAAMALWSTFFGVAFAAMAWWGPAFLDRVGLGGLFLAHGTAMIALAGILAAALRGAPAPVLAAPMLGQVLRRSVTAYTMPHIATPAIGWLFYTFSFVSLLTLLPGLMPEATRAWATAAMPLVSIVVAMGLLPIALRYFPATRLVQIGFLGACLVLMSAPLVPMATLAVGLFAVLGLVQGGGFAAVPELVQTPEDQTQAYGLMAQTGNVGNLVGTPILLALLTYGGETIMILSAIGVFGAAVIVLTTLERKRRFG